MCRREPVTVPNDQNIAGASSSPLSGLILYSPSSVKDGAVI
jgi:hypothetical protein